MPTKDPIGTQLKAIRDARKLSVPQLSSVLKIPADRIYKWEKGLATPKFADRQIVESWMTAKDWGNWKFVPESNGVTGNVNQAIRELREWQISVDATLAILIAEIAPLISSHGGKSVSSVMQQLKKDVDSEITNRIAQLKSGG